MSSIFYYTAKRFLVPCFAVISLKILSTACWHANCVIIQVCYIAQDIDHEYIFGSTSEIFGDVHQLSSPGESRGYSIIQAILVRMWDPKGYSFELFWSKRV